MKIIHFEADQESRKYLPEGKKTREILSPKNALKFKDAEVITIKSQSKINQEVLQRLPHLKLICLRITGYDNVALQECKGRGVAVYYVAEYCTDAVAEHAFALLLSAVRHILLAQYEVSNGRFSYKNLLGYTLNGKTFGVIGTGKIGRQVIKIAKAFGMKIIAYDIAPDKKAVQKLGFKYVSLNELLKKSDIISLHVPLVPNTHHLINDQTIKKMKDGVILINVSRGGIIDTKALIRNINKFRYICLDVLEEEKNFTKDNPLLKFKEKVLITPHCAFYTELTMPRACKETMENVKRFKKGDSHNRLA